MRLSLSVTNFSWRDTDIATALSRIAQAARALFGVGAGYEAAEAAAMGLPLPRVAERFERLEETLRIARQLWCRRPEPIPRRALPARGAGARARRRCPGRIRRS